jgi:DUF4097 and DUF4098 domain-containing protein YvlB
MRNLAILAALIAMPIMAQTETIHPTTTSPVTETRTFALQSGGSLKIDILNGAIKVSAWDKDQVAMTANFRPSSDDEHAMLEIDSKSSSLELVVKRRENFFARARMGERKEAYCDIELKVPRRLASNVSTVNGKIELDSIFGETKVKSVNGAIRLKDIGGDIVARTVNGDLNGAVRNIENDLDISTVNGDVDVKLIKPDATFIASTVNGAIKVATPGAQGLEIKKRSARAAFGNGSAKIKFRTVNGDISVQ